MIRPARLQRITPPALQPVPSSPSASLNPLQTIAPPAFQLLIVGVSLIVAPHVNLSMALSLSHAILQLVRFKVYI